MTFESELNGLKLRRANHKDIPLVTNTWLESYRSSAPCWGIRKSTYYDLEHRILEWWIPQSALLMVCNEADPDQVVGWICYAKLEGALLLHYIYVKSDFRRLGVARTLVNTVLELEGNPPVVTTYSTRTAFEILKNHDDFRTEEDQIGWTYNPYTKLAHMPQFWDQNLYSHKGRPVVATLDTKIRMAGRRRPLEPAE